MTEYLIERLSRRVRGDRREACGLLSGCVGILCNLLLCAAKFAVGALTGAVSVTADAVNNLTDAGVNVVTLAGAKLAGKPVDREHPFGHGRAENIAALAVAFSVFFMSFELAKSAAVKIVRPEDVRLNAVSLCTLGAAVAGKLGMALFNRGLYRRTGSLNLKAVMRDSLNDCVATLAAMLALVLAGRFGLLWADGVIGLAVAGFVFFSGVSLAKEILGPLLGQPPSKELVAQIESRIRSHALILGVHDLIVHNYGPGRSLASAHAEVPADTDLVTAHEAIDRAERDVKAALGVEICLHVDPVDVGDGEREKYRRLTRELLRDYDPALRFHDFRLTERDGKKILSFDLVTPFEYEGRTERILRDLAGLYAARAPETTPDINVEHSYTE